MEHRIDEVRVPSGFEVESASLHTPVPDRTWKEKVVAFPRERIAQAQPKIHELSSKVQQSLRTKPAMWAGIAAGAGLALGIAGRIARHRRAANKRMPAVFVIEGC